MKRHAERLARLELAQAGDALDALSDNELVALVDIARAQCDGRTADAEAIFAAQAPSTKRLFFAAIASLKGTQDAKS